MHFSLLTIIPQRYALSEYGIPWAAAMKDKDLRGILLQKFYDLRDSPAFYSLNEDDYAPLTMAQYGRIGRQLGEQGLLEWSAYMSGGGQGRITAFEVDVVEGEAASPMPIKIFDHSINIHGSNNVQVGNGNSISGNIDISRVMSAIDSAPATEPEKEEARSLLTRLCGNPTFASIAGAIAGMVGGGGSAH